MSHWLDNSFNTNKLKQSYVTGFVDISGANGGNMNLRNNGALSLYDSTHSSIPNFSINADTMRIFDISDQQYYDVPNKQLIHIQDLSENVQLRLSDLAYRTQHLTTGSPTANTMMAFDHSDNNIVIYSNILPASASTYNLGSVEKPFGTLYVNQNTIHFVNPLTEKISASLSINNLTGSLDISTNESTASAIVSYGGNVAIGKQTTNPNYTLDISGNVNIVGTGTRINGVAFSSTGDVNVAGNLYANFPANTIPQNSIQGGLDIGNLGSLDVTITNTITYDEDGFATFSEMTEPIKEVVKYSVADLSFNGVSIFQGDLSVNGTISAKSDLRVGRNLSVKQDASMGGNLTVLGGIYTPTPLSSDSSTRVATTYFVQNKINPILSSIGLMDVSIGLMDVSIGLMDLSINLLQSVKAPIQNPTFEGGITLNSGNLTVSGGIYSANPLSTDNSTRTATTFFVQDRVKNLKDQFDGSFTELASRIDGSITTVVAVIDSSMHTIFANVAVLDSSVNGLTVSKNILDNSVNMLTIAKNILDNSVNSLTIAKNILNSSMSTVFAAVSVLDSSVNSLTIAKNVLDSSVNMLTIAKNVLDSSVNGLTIAKNILDSSVNGLTIAKNILDSSVNGLTIAKNILDSSMSTVFAAVSVLDSSMSTVFANVAVLDSSMSTAFAKVAVLDSSVNGLTIAKNILDSSMHTIFADLATMDTSTKTALDTKAPIINPTFLSGISVASGDVSMNSRLFVNMDASIGGHMYINKDLTVHGRLNVQDYTNESIINTTTTNYAVIIAEDLSLNGRLAISGDASFGQNMQIYGNLDVSGKIYSSNPLTNDNSTRVATTYFVKDQMQTLAGIIDMYLTDLHIKTDSSFAFYEGKTDTSVNVLHSTTDSSFTFYQVQTDTSVNALRTHTDSSFIFYRSQTDTSMNALKTYTDSSINALHTHTDSSFAFFHLQTDTSINALQLKTDTSINVLKSYTDSSFTFYQSQTDTSINVLNIKTDTSLNTLQLKTDNSLNALHSQIDTSLNVLNTHVDSSFTFYKIQTDTSLNSLQTITDTSFTVYNSQTDTSLNSLHSQTDTSLNVLNTHIDSSFTFYHLQTDTSLNSLHSQTDTSLNVLNTHIDSSFTFYHLRTDTSLNSLHSQTDSSFNFYQSQTDSSFNNLKLKTDTSLNHLDSIKAPIINPIFTNGLVLSTGDASFNHNLYIANNTTIGQNLYVQGESLFMDKTIIQNGLTIGGNTALTGNMTIAGQLYAQYPNESIPATAIVGFGGMGSYVAVNNSFPEMVTYDSDMFTIISHSNAEQNAVYDVNVNGNLFASGHTRLMNDTQINQRLFVNGDVSLNGLTYTNRTMNGLVDKTNAGGSPFILDFNEGNTFYLLAEDASFACYFINIPTDSNRVIDLTLYIETSTKLSFCNALKINSIEQNIVYLGGLENVSVSGASTIRQTFTLLRTASSTKVLCKVDSYK